MATRSAANERREALLEKLWPSETPWRGAGGGDKGWFSAPRTLPLLLCMMREKEISRGKGDLGRPYLELLARQRGQGVVEMDAPEIHAYACGFRGKRGTRTWLELMRMLEKARFIKSKSGNGRQYDTVLIVHPSIVVQHLAGQLPEDLLNTYHKRQVEAGERTYEQITAERGEQKESATKVVPMKPTGAATKKR